MPQFDIAFFASQIFWLAITFGLLYLICWRWVLPRLGQVLEMRTARITSYLDEAQALNERSRELMEACEERTAQAQEKARAYAEKARAEMTTWAQEERTKADTQLAEQLKQAQQTIAQAKQKALGEVQATLPGLLVSVLEQVDTAGTLPRDDQTIRKALAATQDLSV